MHFLAEYIQSLHGQVQFTADREEKFRIYRDFLREKNEQFNLTAITDPKEIEIKHFVDSLLALPFIHGNVADIGTGAGFPGVPLSVFLPQYSFTLIDSLQKRISFLDELIDTLALQNVTTVHARAEDLSRSVQYDHVVSRAVAQLNTLCEYCLPFVRVNGTFIAYKSADCNEELQAAKNAVMLLGGEIESVEKIPLTGSDIVRSLIIIRKIKECSSKYPRSGNKPKKQPL